MSRPEDVAAARSHARKTTAYVMRGVWQAGDHAGALDEGRDHAARSAANHLQDSKGDDLALVWARAYADVFDLLRKAAFRSKVRRLAAAKAVL